MQLIFEIIFVLVAFLSLIPVINMFRNRKDKKYTYLKVLIYTTFFWTLLVSLERVSTNTFILYYAGMIGFTLRLLFSILMLGTIYQYVDMKQPKFVKYNLLGVFLVDLGIALTNNYTGWFLKLTRSELVTFNDLYSADYGILFIYHLLVSYIIAITSVLLLFLFLKKQKGIRQYKAVTRMMALGVLLVLGFNLIQLFLVEININLTYISLVVVAYNLYDVIYRQDMVFNLRASGRSEILANMRELYILTDMDHKIIEISPLLIEKYQLSLENVLGKSFKGLKDELSDRVTLYTDYNMEEESYEGKDHYHLREKAFKLKGMKDSGFMILLYDETQVYQLLRELNQLSNFDSMTGLNNRNYIEKKIEQIEHTHNLGIFSIDLNGLKVNNDYLGHERGDYLLKSVANILKSTFKVVKEKDIARIGGDEFMVILYDTTQAELVILQDKLLKACMNDDFEKVISISVGYAHDLEGNQTIYQLIKKADEMMYDMKKSTSKTYRDQLIEYIKKQDNFIR